MCIIIGCVVSATAANAAKAPWATQDQLGAFSIVVASASDSDNVAAANLQRYWHTVTGHELPVVHAYADGPAIFLGLDAIADDQRTDFDLASFGEQELWIKTFEQGGHPQLIIAGGTLGTKYGVYQFIEDYLGVRWLAPGVTHIPEAPDAIPPIDFRYDPVFEFRYTTYFNNVEDRDGLSEYRAMHRYLSGPSFSAHTVYNYLPPEQYFAGHPEYYSLVNGKRVAPTYNWRDHNEHRNHPGEQGQLCWTNPDVLEIIYAKIVADIAANPNATMHHVSQMDWNYYCECDACADIDEREESHVGSVLWGLNQIAERLAADHPDHRIETLAYTYTRKPPKSLKPHDNVIIKLCSIECDFSRPFSDSNSAQNKVFADDIAGWHRIAPRLHIWDYTTNFQNFQSPVPNFHVLQPNMQFLAEHGVKGLFPQGSYDHIAEFADLRAYLVSKLLWNPYLDADAVMNEFIGLYYREAAPFVRGYIALLTNAQQQEGMSMTCFDRGLWYDYETVEQAKALFARAFDAVESDEIRSRMDILYTTVQYAAFKCPPKVEIANDTITVSRPESQTFDEYFAMLQGYGIKRINDYFELQSFVEQTGGKTPPRYLESPLETIENARYLLWIAPSLDGSVIRWYDKKLDLEWLRGFRDYGKVPGTWEDWGNTPGTPERPAADSYEVLDKSKDSITLRARLATGAAIERTLRLTGDDAVEVTLAIINDTDQPLLPMVKVHPEFFTQGIEQPEIWGEKEGEWTNLTAGVRPEEVTFGAIVSAQGFSRLATYLPAVSMSIVSAFDSQDVGALLYFFNVNPDAQHVNLELIPEPTPALQPGERRTIRGVYSVSRVHPREM
jgi:hypothetical protein